MKLLCLWYSINLVASHSSSLMYQYVESQAVLYMHWKLASCFSVKGQFCSRGGALIGSQLFILNNHLLSILF